MPSLITTWNVLLLVAAACEIQLVHSGHLEVGIEIGDFRSEDAQSINAVAKLSNGENQQGWWKLAKAGWHDSAIQRYFAKGPLRPADMEKLANVSGQSAADHTAWVASQIVNVTTNMTDLMLALQGLSTITYAMNKTIQGTGRIEASMWMLLFRCVGIVSCNEGYFVPMIFVPDEYHNYQNANIRSLWLHLTTNLLVNGVPSTIAKLPRAMPIAIADVGDPELSVMHKVYDNVSECPTAAAVLDHRSLLDGSYGLVPGLSCINFGTTSEPFKLLVSRLLFFDNATEPRDISLITLEEFFSALQVKAGQWKLLPFEACSEEGLLIRNSPDSKSVKLCYHKICVTSYVGNYATCSADGVKHLRLLHSITAPSKSCTYNGGKTLQPSNDTVPTEVTCQMSTENEVCHATVDVVDIELAYNVTPLRLLSPKSNWTSTEGIDTSEFSQAPNMIDFNATRMCIRMTSSLSPFFISKTTQAAFLDDIRIRARAYLHSFISEHNRAFMTTKGLATDSGSFLALIVSTAISVILAIAGPFPNLLLRIICRRWPLHLDSGQHSRVNRVVNVLFEMICNVLLSFCSFLPVLYMAWSELHRETPFYTWDLASKDQVLYDSSGSQTQLRVVYLVSATSKYHSNFITGSTLVVSITCIIAGVCSAWRSKEVFDRYAILQKYDSIQAGNDPFKELADRETLLVIRALKAIDMTEAEYLDMKTKVMNHVRIQELEFMIWG